VAEKLENETEWRKQKETGLRIYERKENNKRERKIMKGRNRKKERKKSARNGEK